MATPAGYPLFPSPPNYKVSISLPMSGNSEISKSVGLTSSNGLMVPNIDYLKKFSSGDVGISDSITKQSLFTNMNDPITTKDEKVFKKFGDINGLDTTDINKYKINGKLKINKSDIKAPTNEGTGLKGFEKTLMTSIFETQKPYMEVIKLVTTNIVKMEDITARVMPLIGIPLLTKSTKPNGNPKAMGYNSGKDIKNALSKLQSISKSGTEVIIDKDGNVTRTKTTKKQTKSDPNKWEIISTVYSTGSFNPNVNYQYTFIDLPSEETYPDENYDFNIDEDSKYKPTNIIFGIFHNDGTPLNPNELLKTYGVDGQDIKKMDTIYPLADWILKSPKWKFTNDAYQWPALAQPKFLKDSQGNILRYQKDQKNIISGQPAIEGYPIITGFDDNQVIQYATFFMEHTKYKMNQVDGLEQSEKDQYVKEIMAKINVPSHLENVFLYGQNKASVYKTDPPILMRNSLAPYKIYSAEAAADPKQIAYAKSQGKEPGYIWIDPEGDYEMKIIRVDPTTKIKYEDGKNVSKIESNIKSFVKNKTTFKISNDSNFDIYIKKNEEDPIKIENVNNYTLENWNYLVAENGPKIQNTNSYYIRIVSKTPSKYYSIISEETISNSGYWTELSKNNSIWSYKEYTKDINDNKVYRTVENGVKTLSDNSKVYVENDQISYWFYLDKLYFMENLPKFNKEKIISIDYDNNLELIENDIVIPNYLLKVTSSEFPYGKIIDPSKITNEELKNPELYSTGKYGVGDNNDKQDIDVITRYMLTDLDTESYYIIEGVLVDKNTQTGNPENNASNASGDGGSYRLPHAIGATAIFISLLVSIFALLIPSIVKLLKLLKKPNNFIAETIKEKASNGFDVLSDESISKYKNAKGVSASQIKKSDKVNKTKKVIDNSKLKDTVYVNDKGETKFLLDGSAKVPLDILGTSQTLGLGMNYDSNDIISTDDSNDKEQPLLKFLLGIITFPMKIVSKILEWIMDFFKSLSNPLTLPSKIVEFISFKWILDFFTPKGILDLLGVKFEPGVVPDWVSGKSTPDFSEFLSMPFSAKLPTYKTKDIKDHPERPFKLLCPLFSFLEKIINFIIDLLWAIIGIECLFPSPHISLSSNSINPGQTDADILKKETEKDGFPKQTTADAKVGDVTSGGVQGFLYDITLSNGEVIKGMNYDELQKYITENEDVDYNFKF